MEKYSESFIFEGFHYVVTVLRANRHLLSITRAPCDEFGRVTAEFTGAGSDAKRAVWLEAVLGEIMRRKAYVTDGWVQAG